MPMPASWDTLGGFYPPPPPQSPRTTVGYNNKIYYKTVVDRIIAARSDNDNTRVDT